MDGRTYLEELINGQLLSGAGEAVETRAGAFNLAEFRGVAQGLVAAGALDLDDAATILADLTATLDELGWLPHVRFASTKLSALPTLEATTEAGTVRQQWRELAEQALPPQLIAVHSLAGQHFAIGGIEYSLIALEAWTSLFRVTYAWSRPPSRDLEERLRWHRVLSWSLADDRGKTYRERGGGSHGGEQITFGAQDFEPRLDPEAKRVNITIRDGNDEAAVTIHISRP